MMPGRRAWRRTDQCRDSKVRLQSCVQDSGNARGAPAGSAEARYRHAGAGERFRAAPHFLHRRHARATEFDQRERGLEPVTQARGNTVLDVDTMDRKDDAMLALDVREIEP